LATPLKYKLASGRRHTRQNPDSKLVTPVKNPKKNLKAKGPLEATASVNKPKGLPSKTKSAAELHTLDNPLSDIKDLETEHSELRSEQHQTFPSRNKGKDSLERSLSFDIPSFHRQNFPVSPDSKGCFTPLFPNPKMAGVGRGGGGQPNPPPPGVFAKVAARYAPLVLPAQLHDLPDNYIKNLPKFTGEGDLTAIEHINFFDQFADICGIEHEDVYSRLLVQTFEGQVRTWFRSLPAASIPTYDALEDAFLKQWGERKDHLYYLTEFGSLKKKNSETVMEFILRFNKLYNKIPAAVKPSEPSAKVTFAGAFEPDFALLLRERRGDTLIKMQDDAVEIESNMMASGKMKTKVDTANRDNRRYREPAGPSGSNRYTDDRVDDMARVIRDLSNKISRMELDQAKADSSNKRDFRRNPNPQNQQRQIKNEDQKIPTPLKNENFIGVSDLQEVGDSEDEVAFFEDDYSQPFLTKEEYEESLSAPQTSDEQEEGDHNGLCLSQPETEMIAADFQPRYNLRSKNKPVSAEQPKIILPKGQSQDPPLGETLLPSNKVKIMKNQESKMKKSETQTKGVRPTDEATSSTKNDSDKVIQTKKLEEKNPELLTKETDKANTSYNFENELNKIKIPIPLVELAKNPIYRKQIAKVMGVFESEAHSDVINLEDDRPNITFGPHFEGSKENVAPFYITLNIHDQLLHNCMLDSGASHNVMPRLIMERLGLQITKPYGDLYSFDSRKVKCMGMIKDLVVSLAQIPVKSVLMDVVIADIPPKYGMLLSRSWGAKLGGTIQLDMSYATIPVFGGQFTRLYRETRLAYTVSDPQNPNNFPIYIADQDLGNCILSFDEGLVGCSDELNTTQEELSPLNEELCKNGLWKMYFDGASSSEGAGAGILLIAPEGKFTVPFSYRLQWDIDYTNNVCEYEALILGLEAAKKLNIKNLEVYGDAELIVKQINRQYQAKHPRLRTYRNCAWDLMENFFSSIKIHSIPRTENLHADALAKAASTFSPPTNVKLKYHIEIRYKPSIPDNVRHWQVFEDDEQIQKFLIAVGEFSETHPDQENQHDPMWVIQEDEEPETFREKIADHRMLVLKNNHIPKGLIPLERLFDQNDIPLKSTLQPQPEEVEDCNIGTGEVSKIVKISKFLPPNVKNLYRDLLKQYKDVFAWSYDELRTYDTSIIEHKIPLKPGVKPFRQKLRQFNPILLPVIEREVKKLLDAKIIVPLRYSDWIANLVPVRKKNGEIRLCVDFRNLNKSSLKDNYPLPKMDHVLEKVVGANRMSMIDGFSGYNQIAMNEQDREKTAFTTPWGTFMYDKMPFGLMNAGATFQRAMDIAFVGERDKFVVIYLDDLTVFSKTDEEHLSHLKQTFEKCRRYGLSLNPKKSHFAMQEGKLLGHIVFKDGIKIDPKRVEAIQTINIPRNVKEIQAFLGTINFLRRFVPNFAEIVKLITGMLKKDSKVKWTTEAKVSFEHIKKVISEAPVLSSPDYLKDFLIFSFASEHTIAAVLLQKDDGGFERPIAFFSKSLRDAELKYNILEKQAYAMVKALKAFRTYVLHSKIIAYVPTSAVKDILVQPDSDGKRGRWLAKIQEFDLEVKPTKLIKGQGLAKLLAESNLRALDIDCLQGEDEDTHLQEPNDKTYPDQVEEKFISSDWYRDIVFYLSNLKCPDELTPSKRRTLKLHAVKYCISEGQLYWKDPLGFLLICLVESETPQVIEEFHEGICGGHHAWRATAYKILRAGYYWPKLFSDVNAKVRACHSCQIFAGKQKLPALPLVPVKTEAPFQQWGLDFIGEINPHSSAQHKWILTATDYFTKWVEAIPTKRATDSVVIDFLENNILTRFGCPRKIVTDNAQAFKSMAMINLCQKYSIVLGHSTAYYPQGNGLAESSNKSLVNVIKKVLDQNKRSWHIHLKYALWANRISTKRSIGISPFQMVYGTEAVLPVNLALPVIKLWQDQNEEPNHVTRRINQMIEVQELRVEVDEKVQKYQEDMKALFDLKAKDREFLPGDLVLRWGARREEAAKHGKFDHLWYGPFRVSAPEGKNSFLLENIDGEVLSAPVNGRYLKHYMT
jgi:ribonuclease HI